MAEQGNIYLSWRSDHNVHMSHLLDVVYADVLCLPLSAGLGTIMALRNQIKLKIRPLPLEIH